MAIKTTTFAWSLSVVIFTIGVSSIKAIGSSTILTSSENSSVDAADADDVLSAKPLHPNGEKDECKDLSNCPFRATSTCINTQGSYYCVCKSGYTKWESFSVETEGCRPADSKLLWWIVFANFVIDAGIVIIAVRRCYLIYKRRQAIQALLDSDTDVSINVLV